MNNWWEIPGTLPDEVPRPGAVAYYRHSAQDRQENSIPLQQEQVREWAEKHGLEIIKEFADAGRSGLTAEGRPEFTEMMEEWVKKRDDFVYVLCLDVSRWGRFQDLDLSAQYSSECKRNGKQVVYTTIGLPKDNDDIQPLYVQFERFRAARYSKELSEKVWRGCMKIAQQGYWAGGPPPYAMQRLLLDEKREPVGILEPGKRKAIQNQRVTLVTEGGTAAKTIHRIFDEFTEKGYSEFRIAEGLNAEEIPAARGGRWTGPMVLTRLQNEKYVGTMIYNQTTRKLKTPQRPNPPEQWVRTPEAFEGIISLEQFLKAQQVLLQRRQKYDPEYMLGQLSRLYQQYGLLRLPMLRILEEAAGPATFSRRFGGLDLAFQQMHREPRDRAREMVHEQIRQQVPEVLPYSDFLVLDQRLAVSVQPAVPIPSGYAAYWPFRPDARQVIDLTLGVLLSDTEDFEILGYVALPRWLAGPRTLRVSATSPRTELFGRRDLAFLQQLL